MKPKTKYFIELLIAMTQREFRARYKYTLFGFFWLVANPVLQMLVIGFVFTFFVKEPIVNYYYFLFIGLLVWNFFSLTMSRTTTSLVAERALIKKARFPHAVIPLSILISNFIHFLAGLGLFVIPVLFLKTLSPIGLITIPIASILLIVFTTGLALLVSSLNVRFRDINFLVQAMLLIWFYASPIVYSLAQMPPKLLWLWHFNPLTVILQLYQNAFLGSALPGPLMTASNVGVIVVVFILGIKSFEAESKNFDDWL